MNKLSLLEYPPNKQEIIGMTKYRKGPTKDRKGALRRTAKEHYRLGCRKLAPIEINGALYSNACQVLQNSLIHFSIYFVPAW